MESLGFKDIRSIVSGIAGLMAEKKDELISLDGAMGDGDLGLTMEKGFAAAREEADKTDEPDLGRFLMKIGMALAKAAPSTMGTLVATGFMSGGKAVMGTAALGGKEMAAFWDAFAAGIMQRGKAKPGEKTIVDVLLPAAEAFKEKVSGGANLAEAFRALKKGAEEGRERARDMVAQHGRLAYYQEQSRGRDDPGAVACLYILRSFAEAVTGPA
jgi:phosphoenolpyruvate---glycerone phosphotransferase subunit DhaL